VHSFFFFLGGEYINSLLLCGINTHYFIIGMVGLPIILRNSNSTGL